MRTTKLVVKEIMSSTDEKLDALLTSVSELRKEQTTTRRDLESKIASLEEDVKSSHQDAAERAVKKAKRERPLEFKRKGHEEQYYFNQDIGDCIASATKQLGKITPTSDKDKATVEKTIKELEEGATLIVQRQKFIRIADQSEHHWQTVAAYKGNDLASDEEDAKRLEKAERTAEQQASKKRRKTAASRFAARHNADNGPASAPAQKPPLPRPQFSGRYSGARTPGPCFHCFEMGHLKAACPKLTTTYPFGSNVDVCSITVCMCKSVCAYKAKGALDSVSFPKGSDDRHHKSVDSLDAKASEDTVGSLMGDALPKTGDCLQHRGAKLLDTIVSDSPGDSACDSPVTSGQSERPGSPSAGSISGSQSHGDTGRVLDSPLLEKSFPALMNWEMTLS